MNNYFETELKDQNIDYKSLLTMPVGIANINWYGVAKTDEGIYMHKYSILEDIKVPFEYFSVYEYLLYSAESGMGKSSSVNADTKWSSRTFLLKSIPNHLVVSIDEVEPIAAEKMRWFAKGFYTTVRDGEKIRIYNLQVDMRGVIKKGETNAPTAGYFEITPHSDGSFDFGSGTHNSK